MCGLSYLPIIEVFPPILEPFCPLFVQIAQMGLTLPRWGHPQTLFFTQPSHNPIASGDIYKHKTPQSPPKTPLSWPEVRLNLKVNNLDPNCAKCFEKWFLEMGKNNLLMSYVLLLQVWLCSVMRHSGPKCHIGCIMTWIVWL